VLNARGVERETVTPAAGRGEAASVGTVTSASASGRLTQQSTATRQTGRRCDVRGPICRREGHRRGEYSLSYRTTGGMAASRPRTPKRVTSRQVVPESTFAERCRVSPRRRSLGLSSVPERPPDPGLAAARPEILFMARRAMRWGIALTRLASRAGCRRRGGGRSQPLVSVPSTNPHFAAPVLPPTPPPLPHLKRQVVMGPSQCVA
jgi:hypothetical protein